MQRVEYLNIYDFLGHSSDPLFNQLQQLKKRNPAEMHLQGYQIRLTDKFYEVESDELHTGFVDIMGCYRFLVNDLESKLL